MSGFVYVISGDHGRCKVGVTSNPAVRIESLRTASAFPLSCAFLGAVENSASAVERGAQSLLDDDRTAGEWFNTSPEKAIAAVWEAAAKLKDKIQVVEETPMKRINFLVSPENYKRLKRLAIDTERSTANLMQEALGYFFEKHPEA